MMRYTMACLVGAWLGGLVPFSGADEPADAVRMVVPGGDHAKYWPCWRGPTGQGLAVGPGEYPDKWSDTENVLWKVPVPGKGNSSPIIWKDRLFLTASYDQGKKRSLLCFDRGNGKTLWECALSRGKPEGAYGKNGWASGTPATDGQRVYCYFGNLGVVAVDFDGKEVWHAGLGEVNAFHGMACSPLLHEDKVIIFQDLPGKAAGFVVALDKHSGKEVWKTPRSENVGWSSPIAIRVEGKDQIIVSSQSRVCAYDPSNGKEIWTCSGNLAEVIPTPVVGHGMIFCCSGRAGPTLAISPDGTGDVTRTKKLVWKTVKGSPFVPSPLLQGDYLYMVNDVVSVVSCFEAKTGKMMWQKRCGQATQHGFSASPVGVNGKVFFTNDDGETFVLAAGPEFQLLHVNRLNARTLASPALVDGRWYFRTEKELFCIGK